MRAKDNEAVLDRQTAAGPAFAEAGLCLGLYPGCITVLRSTVSRSFEAR